MRSEVDACCKLASELLDKSRKFYEIPGDAPQARSLSADIKFQFARLLKRTERLEKQHTAFRLKDPVADLMESMTGGQFESVTRTAEEPNSARLIAIESDVHGVMDELEGAFGRIYGGVPWSVQLRRYLRGLWAGAPS